MNGKHLPAVALVTVILSLSGCGGLPASSPDKVTPPAICPYRLPFAEERGNYTVTQVNLSQDPSWSHRPGRPEQYAFDFGLPDGTPVLATRAGLVVRVQEGNTVCGGPGMANFANFVIVDHEDGTFAFYSHLEPNVLVDEGSRVGQGDILGYSGNSGFTYCGYHLHFQLQESGEGFSDSIPTPCFEGLDGLPKLYQVLAPSDQIQAVGGYATGQEGGTQTPIPFGLWEGPVAGGGEGGSYDDLIRQIRIGETIEFYWENGHTDTIGYMGEEDDSYCYWRPLNLPEFPGAFEYKFCFRLQADGTLYYQGFGNLWGEEGTLHWVSE